MVKLSLEDYFKQNLDKGIIDHAVRANKNGDGSVSFYIHPNGFDGDTLDFTVKSDFIYPLHSVNLSSSSAIAKCNVCEKEYRVASGASMPICHGEYMRESEVI